MQARISPRDHKAMIDRKAAALILQQWLEEKRRLRPVTIT